MIGIKKPELLKERFKGAFSQFWLDKVTRKKMSTKQKFEMADVAMKVVEEYFIKEQ
jgi:hypothetical protein